MKTEYTSGGGKIQNASKLDSDLVARLLYGAEKEKLMFIVNINNR